MELTAGESEVRAGVIPAVLSALPEPLVAVVDTGLCEFADGREAVAVATATLGLPMGRDGWTAEPSLARQARVRTPSRRDG